MISHSYQNVYQPPQFPYQNVQPHCIGQPFNQPLNQPSLQYNNPFLSNNTNPTNSPSNYSHSHHPNNYAVSLNSVSAFSLCLYFLLFYLSYGKVNYCIHREDLLESMIRMKGDPLIGSGSFSWSEIIRPSVCQPMLTSYIHMWQGHGSIEIMIESWVSRGEEWQDMIFAHLKDYCI